MSAKNTKAAGPSPIVKLALGGMVVMAYWYLYQGMLGLSHKIVELPVLGKAQVAAPASAPDATKRLTTGMDPLLIESHQKATALNADAKAGAVGMDALFGRDEAQQEMDAKKKKEAELDRAAKAPPVPSSLPALPALPPVDQFKVLAQSVRVQAVMADGAIINGRFYTVGSDVTTLGYPAEDGKKMLYPSLFSINEDIVLLAEAAGGKRKIQAKLLR